ncbi:MAG TPA: hypothetical protein VH352_19645 [Pseudonocardiaceae bacterium]|nr:hypothetical protein [Pseudonocardiaceae bacterium]
MTARRSTERLVADAEERLRLTENLPSRIESIRGRAHNDAHTVLVTTTVHGALAGLDIAEDALALGPERLGAEIVRLAGAANRAALHEGIDVLSRVLGDGGTVELARSVGLIEQEPLSPVPVVAPDDDDYALDFDFSSLRSDR